MTTTNNTNYSVKDLVAKYRNFVIENAPTKTDRIAEELKIEEGLRIPLSSLDYHPDYQLIITLYNAVAGDKADKQVQQEMSNYANQYYKDALTTEEFYFLCENFSDTISELFKNGMTLNGNKEDYSQLFSSPKRLQLLKERCIPQQGATIYMCDSGCDIAELYPNCNVVGEMYGVLDYEPDYILGRIWLYSKNIVSQLGIYLVDTDGQDYWPVSRLSIPTPLDYVISGTTNKNIIEKLYNKLSPYGKMFVFTSYKDMAEHDEEMKSFRQRLVADKSIASIISFKEGWRAQRILLIIEKCQHEKVEIISEYSDKRIVISSDFLDSNILWPGYYITSRPRDGVSLSTIAYGKKLKDIDELFEADDEPNTEENTSVAVTETDTEDNLFVENVVHVLGDDWFAGLPEVNDGPWQDRLKKEFEFREEVFPHMHVVTPINMSSDYKDADICSQRLITVDDPMCDNERNSFVIIEEQPCVLLALSSRYNKLIAGYISTFSPEGFCTGKPISCLVPRQGIDVRYLCALLLSSSISEQIHLVCDGTNNVLSLILDKIIVPNHDEKERLQFLAEANYEALQSSQKELKEEQENYKKAVRRRKHALTQSLSSIDSSFKTLNSFRKRNHGVLNDDDCISRIRKTTVGNVFDYLSQELKDIMPVMEHIADVKYDFGSSEWIDPEDFLDDYIARNENSWLNFKPMKDWAHGQNKYKKDIVDSKTGKTLKKEGESIHKLFFTKKALEIVLDNIVSNAKSHGFTDKERKNYLLKFSWEIVDFNLEIRVENNGTPIPSDRNTASLMEYGVSTALHQNGHNGIGCSDIDDIMQRYEGKVQLVSTPEEEFTVKYLLSFQTNFM